MYKKEVTYKDYNGVERTETFYFNLTQSELLELESSIPGGMANRMAEISAAKDMPEMMKFFKMLMRKTYGEKSPDGRRLIKKEGALFDEFVETPAYDIIIQDIFFGDGMKDFITNIMPAEYADKIRPSLDEYLKTGKLPSGE